MCMMSVLLWDMATSLLPPPYTPKAACISFGMWGHVLDVINHAKFQRDRFGGFGAPGGRKSLSPIDCRYHPYNDVRTNVLDCDCRCLQCVAASVEPSRTSWLVVATWHACGVTETAGIAAAHRPCWGRRRRRQDARVAHHCGNISW